MLKVIEKQLLAENLGITPSNDGKVIRLVFPQLTEERRKELVKQVKKMAEDAKVAVRNVRRDCMDEIKKLKNAKEISEDEGRRRGEGGGKDRDQDRRLDRRGRGLKRKGRSRRIMEEEKIPRHIGIIMDRATAAGQQQKGKSALTAIRPVRKTCRKWRNTLSGGAWK